MNVKRCDVIFIMFAIERPKGSTCYTYDILHKNIVTLLSVTYVLHDTQRTQRRVYIDTFWTHPSPFGLNIFIFTQFTGKYGEIKCLCPLLRNLEYATDKFGLTL